MANFAVLWTTWDTPRGLAETYYIVLEDVGEGISSIRFDAIDP